MTALLIALLTAIAKALGQDVVNGVLQELQALQASAEAQNAGAATQKAADQAAQTGADVQAAAAAAAIAQADKDAPTAEAAMQRLKDGTA